MRKFRRTRKTDFLGYVALSSAIAVVISFIGNFGLPAGISVFMVMIVSSLYTSVKFGW